MLELIHLYNQIVALLEGKPGKFANTEDWNKYTALKKRIAEVSEKTWVNIHGDTITAPKGDLTGVPPFNKNQNG